MKTEDFIIITEKICLLFPEECAETYYIPPVSSKCSPDKKPINAKGKLVDKYRNLKRIYTVNQVLREEPEQPLHLESTFVINEGKFILYINYLFYTLR